MKEELMRSWKSWYYKVFLAVCLVPLLPGAISSL